MRKIILCIILCLLVSVSLFALGGPEIAYENYDSYELTQPELILAPFTSISGVSMSSPYYPKRASGEELKKYEGSLSDWVNSTDKTSSYVDDHIVVTGGLYNFPFVYFLREENAGGTFSDMRRYFAVLDNPNLEITVDCPTDFMFVSQSNTSYQRPLELTAIPYSANGQEYEKDIIDSNSIETYNSITYSSRSNNNQSFTYDVSANVYSARYGHMWFDLILDLPIDEVTNTGIISDGVVYDLQEEDDYTAVVTITISFIPTYSIYTITRTSISDWEWTYSYFYDDTGEDIQGERIERVITIPFSGFYSRLSSENRNDSIASFYVEQMPSASNLTLNSAVPRQFIDIADITMLYNRPRSSSEPVIGEEDGEIAKIFLSSSSDPEDATATDFMFVHERASSIIEGRNALGYTIRLTDLTDGTSEIYDGSDYINSAGNMMTDGKFMESHCHTAHPSHLDEWSHFHTFEGTVSILIDDSTTMMEPGIYKSNVYIHLVTEDA